MSVLITLKPGIHDGDSSTTEGMPPGLVYLSASLEASDEQYSGFVSGWMRPEARALLKAAPELLEALRPFAKFACDTPCDCHNCRARAAIAKATGEA